MGSAHDQSFATLRAVLKDQVLDASVAFENDTPLAPLGVDSMSYVRMLMAVEAQHGIVFPDDEMTPENLATVENLATALFRVSQG